MIRLFNDKMWSVRCTKSNQIAVVLTSVSSSFYQLDKKKSQWDGIRVELQEPEFGEFELFT